METKIVLPPCKYEDIPVIGGFVINRAEKDLAEISAAAPDIDKTVLDALNVKKEEVRVIVRPAEKTSEIKAVTKRMYHTMDDLKPKLDLFEIKLNHAAAELKKTPESFGLSNLRLQLRTHKAEGTLSAIEHLLHEIDTDAAVLQSKGFTPEMRAEFASAQSSISTDNELQNEKVDERGELTAENKLIIAEFWLGIQDLMRTGRLLYKNNPVKSKEYTFAVLHRRVRLTRKPDNTKNGSADKTAGSLSITATNKATGEALAGVQISVLNKNLKTETDAHGEGNFEGLAAGKLNLRLEKTGFTEMLINDVLIKAGEETELDVEMVGT